MRAAAQEHRRTLDHVTCAQLLAGMELLDEVLQASGQYRPRVEAPDDADV